MLWLKNTPFHVPQNPLGTAAADTLTMLLDCCDNSQTAKITSTRKVLQERYFSPRIFWGVGDEFVTSFVTSNWRKTKNYSSQKNSTYVQKHFEKYAKTLEKFILLKKCWPRPTDCKKIVQIFLGHREEFVSVLVFSLFFS